MESTRNNISEFLCFSFFFPEFCYDGNMNILHKLKEQINFTSTDKVIADYILSHKDEAVEMSIQKLAEATYTSTTAVMRLCERLKLSGYKQLKIELSREINDPATDDELLDPSFPFHPDSSTGEIANSLKKLIDQSLNEARKTLSVTDMNRAADILINANQRALFGIGDAYLAGLSFQTRMLRIGMHFLTTPVYGEQGHLAQAMTSSDAALILSYSGTTDQTLLSARRLKQNRVRIVSITGNADSPLARLSDVVLVIPAKEHKFHRIASFFSQACMDYYLNILYSRIYVQNYRNFQDKNID